MSICPVPIQWRGSNLHVDQKAVYCYIRRNLYREEKSLRHVHMVPKFLDDNKPKVHLKSEFTLFHT